MQSKTHHVRRRHSTHTRVVAPSVSFLRLCTIRMPDWREFNPACTPLQYFQTAYSYIMKYQSIFLILLLVYCQWPVWLVSTFKLQYWRYRVNQPRETLLFCQRIFEIRHTTIFDIKDTTLRAAAWVEAKLLIIERVPLCHWFKWPLGLVRGLVGCQAAGHIPDTALQKEHVTVLSGFVPQLPHRLRRHHGRLLNLHQVAHQPLPLHPWRVSATSICRNLKFENSNVSFRFACGKFEARMFSSTRRPIVYIVCRDSRFRAVLLWCSLKCPYFTGSTTLPCAKWTRFWLKSSS